MQTIDTNSQNPNATSLVASASAESVTPISNGLLTPEFLTALAAGANQLEAVLGGAPTVNPSERTRLRKRRSDDRAFAQGIAEIVQQHETLVPRHTDAAGAQLEQEQIAALTAVIDRLQELLGRLDDVRSLAGARQVDNARAIYRVLKAQPGSEELKAKLTLVGRRLRRPVNKKQKATPGGNAQAPSPTPATPNPAK